VSARSGHRGNFSAEDSRRANKGRKDPSLGVEEGFARLQRGLTGDRELVGAAYLDGRDNLAAYLSYYWPVSREQARRAIDWTREASLGKKFFRVIDVGSGPGPVAAAFVDAGAEEVCLVDQSGKALDLALAEIPRRCARSASLSTTVADISAPSAGLTPLWGTADCVSFGHSLNELFSGEENRVARRVSLLESYATALAPQGLILLIEPALLSTSRDVLAVRDELIERGWSVVAPCPGRAKLPCPALAAGASQTCHDEISWEPPASVAELAKKNGIDKDSLKMTWLALRPPASPEKPRDEGLTPAVAGDAGDARFWVVSDPLLNKGGRTRRLVCGGQGRFPLSCRAGSPEAVSSGFDELRRGDLIRVEKPEVRENGWGVGPETVISKA